MNLLVVGAGIGGLSFAIAASRLGHRVVLAERAPRPTGVGAGIVLAPNAHVALASLGVDVSTRGQRLGAMFVTDAAGRVLTRLDASGLPEGMGVIWALSRPDLHDLLAEALPPGVEARFGTSVEAVRPLADGVEVELGGHTERFDAVIGADGLRSRVREAVLGAVPVRYSGVTCWRGIVENPGLDAAIEAWGGPARVGAIPLRGGRLYYFLVLTAPPRAPMPAWPADFRAKFAHFSGEPGRVIAALDGPPPLHHDLDELDAPAWGRDRVALLGDAAHAMTPNQGQGAAMAIEDALALAGLLDGGPAGLAERLAAARQERVRKVQLDSRRFGEVAHWENPLATWVRNTALRLVPAAAGRRQYAQLVEPGLGLVRDAAR